MKVLSRLRFFFLGAFILLLVSLLVKNTYISATLAMGIHPREDLPWLFSDENLL